MLNTKVVPVLCSIRKRKNNALYLRIDAEEQEVLLKKHFNVAPYTLTVVHEEDDCKALVVLLLVIRLTVRVI